jgi:hypothetical protein
VLHGVLYPEAHKNGTKKKTEILHLKIRRFLFILILISFMTCLSSTRRPALLARRKLFGYYRTFSGPVREPLQDRHGRQQLELEGTGIDVVTLHLGRILSSGYVSPEEKTTCVPTYRIRSNFDQTRSHPWISMYSITVTLRNQASQNPPLPRALCPFFSHFPSVIG